MHFFYWVFVLGVVFLDLHTLDYEADIQETPDIFDLMADSQEIRHMLALVVSFCCAVF